MGSALPSFQCDHTAITETPTEMTAIPSLQALRERDERLHEHMILKYGHLSKGRLSARDQEIVDTNRRALQRGIERIWAEQEAENARLRALSVPDVPRLAVIDRYARARR